MKPRILLLTLVVGALASCCTPPTEERTAIVPYSSRDADTGQFVDITGTTSITVSVAATGTYSGVHLVFGTDDTAAIQAAAAAADALTPKGTVYLPRGGYIITDSVFNQSYADGTPTYSVIGDGGRQTTFYPAPSHAKTGDTFLQKASNAHGALFQGFGWDASHHDFATNFYVMAPGLGATCRDLYMVNMKGMMAFIYAFNGQGFLDSCHFEAAGNVGLMVVGGVLVHNSYSGNHYGNGVYITGGGTLTWLGGTLDECVYRTVYVDTNSKLVLNSALVYGNGSTNAIIEVVGEARIDNCRIEPYNTGYNEQGLKVVTGGLLQLMNCTVKGYGNSGHAVNVDGGEALIANCVLTSTGSGHALNILSGATARLTCTKLTASGAGDGLANAGTCHDGGGNVADSKSGSAPVTTAL